MRQSFLLICCLLVATVTNAKTYSVAMSYLKASDVADCSGYEDTIHYISEQALFAAGVSKAGNSENWKVFGNGNANGNSNGNANGNGNPDNVNGFRSLLEGALEGHRDLGGCGDCRTLCLTTGIQSYCDCCSCCGGSRRYLKNLSEDQIDAFEEQAQANALELLAALEDPIPCLQSDSYQVEVLIG